MANDMLETAGKLAFLGGVVISVIAGFVTLNATLISVLMVLGLLVGFLNVSPKESHKFLVAAVSLVIVSSLAGAQFSTIAAIGPTLQSVFQALMSFVVPATVVVAIASLYSVAAD